jgi:flavorubredoxin
LPAVTVQSIADIEGADLGHAVPLGDRVWWVGHHQQDDVFQCHVYLIEQEDQSVLLDPGSNLTFGRTLAKIEEIIPFSSIRYFVCHHQDPDIAAALPAVDSMVRRPDAVLVTHWRAQMLLKHYGRGPRLAFTPGRPGAELHLHALCAFPRRVLHL